MHPTNDWPQAIESRMDELLHRQSSLERSVSESLKRHKDDHAELLSTLRGRLGAFGDQ